MSGYRLTLAAEDDIDEIWRYLALERRSSVAAVTGQGGHLRGLRAPRVDAARRSPRRRSDQATPLVLAVLKTDYVAYRIDTHPLTIVRVLHGRRDVESILEAD